MFFERMLIGALCGNNISGDGIVPMRSCPAKDSFACIFLYIFVCSCIFFLCLYVFAVVCMFLCVF